MRTGGQVGFSFEEGVPGRDRRAKAVLVEKQELPLGHSERSVFVLLGPPNNSPFVIKPASSSCLENWRSLSSLQTEGGSQRQRQCSHQRRREQPPFLPLTLTASCFRCSPASSEMRAIPPSGLRMLTFREFCVHLFVHSWILHPAWSSSWVPTYIFSFITCQDVRLMTLCCNHSRPLTSGPFLM